MGFRGQMPDSPDRSLAWQWAPIGGAYEGGSLPLVRIQLRNRSQVAGQAADPGSPSAIVILTLFARGMSGAGMPCHYWQS
jgi:hypothetical protein